MLAAFPVVQLKDLESREEQIDLFSFDDLPGEWGHEGPVTWTDGDIATIREGLLYASLRDMLDPRCGEETRTEIKKWLEEDVIAPFSFRVCADQVDVCPDSLRELVRDLDRRNNTHSRRHSLIKARVERAIKQRTESNQFDWLGLFAA